MCKALLEYGISEPQYAPSNLTSTDPKPDNNSDDDSQDFLDPTVPLPSNLPANLQHPGVPSEPSTVSYMGLLSGITDSDESTHQILSYGLLFLTFYHFPYTAGPPTSTAPMRPSPTFAWRFTRLPPTIPYTHCTIGPVPCQRPFIWPTDHIITFPFLSLFSFTQRILLWSDQSQIVAPRNRDLTICFTAHEPCVRFTYRLYLRLLYLLRNRRKFSPRTQT